MPTIQSTPWTSTPTANDESKWYQGQGYSWTPKGWAKQDPNGNWNPASYIGTSSGNGSGGSPGLSELVEQYSKSGAAFNTGEFDRASEAQQSRVLATAMNAGNNAATEYANKARQAGGSGMGAGLVKAEAQVGARATAGDMELKRQQFDVQQREAAATHASQIAQTLGSLRTDYLKSLLSYRSNENQINAQRDIATQQDTLQREQLAEQKREFNYKLPNGGGYGTDMLGNMTGLYGTPFRDPITGMPSNDPKLAPPSNYRGW